MRLSCKVTRISPCPERTSCNHAAFNGATAVDVRPAGADTAAATSFTLTACNPASGDVYVYNSATGGLDNESLVRMSSAQTGVTTQHCSSSSS